MRPQKNWLPFHPFGSRHLAASAFLLLTIPAAFAADDATCDAYAAFAISKEAQTAARACGYSGAPWSTNYVGHLNWCLATKDEHVHDQWNQRRDAIARCNRCVSYSINATYFAERARALACKFDFNHPQWSPIMRIIFAGAPGQTTSRDNTRKRAAPIRSTGARLVPSMQKSRPAFRIAHGSGAARFPGRAGAQMRTRTIPGAWASKSAHARPQSTWKGWNAATRRPCASLPA
jgi:hypothetical protein